MRIRCSLPICLGLLAGLAFLGGCSEAPAPSKTDTKPASKPSASTPDKHADHKDHAHPEHGPHEGSLVELGNEEYHAEVVHDEDSGAVTIYILDNEAKGAVSIEATELVVNVTQDGKGKQLKLAAQPLKGESSGRSSRFVSDGKELGELLDSEDAKARLTVEIEGKSYSGAIEHAHEHEEDHKHADEK